MRHLGLSTLARALLGLAVVQLALPKLLPLPGVSAQWLVLFLGGGVPGIIATLLGGLLLAAWGVGLVPTRLTPAQLGTLSMAAAVGSRVVGLAGAALLGLEVRWWPGEEPGTGALLGLLVVALLYGGAAYTIARFIHLAQHSPTLDRTLENL